MVSLQYSRLPVYGHGDFKLFLRWLLLNLSVIVTVSLSVTLINDCIKNGRNNVTLMGLLIFVLSFSAFVQVIQ